VSGELDSLGLQKELQIIHNAFNDYSSAIDALLQFTLPGAEADHLLWCLAKENVTGASLFPGYDGAARAVREKLLWRTQ
jgi:hypothetical protein